MLGSTDIFPGLKFNPHFQNQEGGEPLDHLKASSKHRIGNAVAVTSLQIPCLVPLPLPSLIIFMGEPLKTIANGSMQSSRVCSRLARDEAHNEPLPLQ